ncbi:hypothetical protein [Companilactobacillus sp. DQM5]|uniref:hypothetical protein n=1 Tax=Companilactobacillus sp. DQM5 TaxID=3463359 RepID=UPI0040594C9B
MFKSKSSILSIHFDDTIEIPVGERVEKYLNPDDFNIEIDSGKYKFAVERIRISLPDIDGEDEIEEVFKNEKKYNQTIYVVIPGVREFPEAKTAINGRPIDPAERILIDQDILVLKRELNVVENVNEVLGEYEPIDLNKELEQNTNSVWNNIEIGPQQFITKDDLKEIPLFDDFGNIYDNEILTPGEEFNVHIKRINILEKIEYYKIYENRYVRAEDVFPKENSLGDNLFLENSYPQENLEANELIEIEDVTPFEVKYINKNNPTLYDFAGNLIPDFVIDYGTIISVQGVSTDGKYYRIFGETLVLIDDVEEISSGNEYSNLTEEQELAKSDINETTYDQEDVNVETKDVEEVDLSNNIVEQDDSQEFTETDTSEDTYDQRNIEDSEFEFSREEDDFVDEDYNEEMAKTDANAVKKAFDIVFDENSREINGIVQIKGEEKNSYQLFNTYSSKKRRLLKENVKGGTFWYTSEVGNDNKGDKYYKIAGGTWVAAKNVIYFDK